MKKLCFYVLMMIFCVKDLCAQEAKDLSKYYDIFSTPYSVPDNDQQNFTDVDFRFGWTGKAPYTIAVQFVNHAYADRKFKFAIKDVTSNKMVVLDRAHNSFFGSETLKSNSLSKIWSGLVDDNRDSFSLRVWDSDGDEFDKMPISVKSQK